MRNINEAYLPNIYNFFRKIGVFDIDYPAVITSLTSCTGADTCRLGICMPKGAIDAITRRLLQSDLDLDAIPDFELKMNGCTNICANATWADLGFSGRVGRVGDDPFPAYTVWLPVNGRNEIDLAQGWIAAKHIPAFVEDYLRDVIAQKDNYESYYVYVRERGSEFARNLLETKYKAVPAFSEDPDFFFDYSDDEKFSLIKYGQAECSAGLFDIIDIDQDTIREKRKELASAADSAAQEKILADIVFSEARMLLVTRGLDPRTDDDVYDGFITEFIKAGIVPAKYKVLIDTRRSGGSLIAYRELIEELADLLNDLYKNMDDSLQFHGVSEGQKDGSPEERKEVQSNDKAKEGQPNVKATEGVGDGEVKIDVFKDFRGVACPMNFVKTKIALTPMQSGQILQILLDDGQPIQNVPGSVKNEGHTVLATEKVDNYWKVTIKKK